MSTKNKRQTNLLLCLKFPSVFSPSLVDPFEFIPMNPGSTVYIQLYMTYLLWSLAEAFQFPVHARVRALKQF